MLWYNYFAAFFAGIFPVNSVPHFFHGISEDKYPTPFANLLFKGLSSPLINIIWALLNLVLGTILVFGSNLLKLNTLGTTLFFVGIIVICVSSFVFAGKKNQILKLEKECCL